MTKRLQGVIATLVLVVCGSALAGYVSMQKDQATTRISALSLDSTRWTGWINVAQRRSVALEIAFTHTAATAVTMRCESSDSPATANDAGFDVKILEDSGTSGTLSSVTLTLSEAVAGNEKWTWTVANIPHDFVNCAFAGTSAGANDKATVKSKGISP